jgi:uncharacterized membrane protein
MAKEISCLVNVPIDVPADRAFQAMIDFPNAPQRISAIKRIEMLTDGPVRVGTRFRETRVMFGREATETMEISKFEPGRSYELTATSCGCLYRSEIRIDPRGPQACDLTMTFRATPQSMLARIVGFLFRGMTKSCQKMMRKDFEDMKRALEAAR